MNKSVTLKIKKTKINQTEQGQIIRDELHFDSRSKTAAEKSKQQVTPERFQVWSFSFPSETHLTDITIIYSVRQRLLQSSHVFSCW